MQFVRSVRDVRAFTTAVGNHEKTLETHNVIDAKAIGMQEGAPQR
jgi:hypothetical protein